jgi:hypothetical protein
MRSAAVRNVVPVSELPLRVSDGLLCRCGGGAPADPEAEARWVFVARCQHRSQAEMTMYADHMAAQEDAGEDFFGNFS